MPHAAPAIAEAFGEKTAHAGDAVVVHGLTSEAGQRLNGMRATVVRLDLKKGRFLVALQPSGEEKGIKPTNLRRASSEKPKVAARFEVRGRPPRSRC